MFEAVFGKEWGQDSRDDYITGMEFRIPLRLGLGRKWEKVNSLGRELDKGDLS